MSRLTDFGDRDPKHDFIDDKILRATFSIQELLQIAGIGVNGRNSQMALDSLRRLSGVTIKTIDRGDETNSQRYRLISLFEPENRADRGNRLHVAINPRLTRFLLRLERQHTRISLREVRELGTNYAARVMHQRLCAVINDNDERELKMGTLLSYLHPDDQAACDADKLRAEHITSFKKLLGKRDDLLTQRVNETAKALNFLEEKLGWEVKQIRDNVPWNDILCRIKRAKSSRTKLELNLRRLAEKRGKAE